MFSEGDLASRAIVVTLRSSIFHGSSKTAESWWACAMFQAASTLHHTRDKFYQAQLPRFSACNTEKLKEPVDEAKCSHGMMQRLPKYAHYNHWLCLDIPGHPNIMHMHMYHLHRHRNILKVDGARNIIACAKFFDHAHITLGPRPFLH